MASPLSLDKILESVPPEKLDALCKDVHLCEIALSITDWEVIAPFLGISRAEAEVINRDEGKTVSQRIGMLRKWKEKCGRKATYRRLAKRLLKVERVDLVDKICKVLGDSKCTTDDDSSDVPDDGSPIPSRKGFVHQTILDQYAYHLCDVYPKVIPSFAQWPPSPTHKFFNLAMIQRSRIQRGPIDENYIRLTQRGSVDDIMVNKTPIQVKDIFHLYHDSSKRVIVLIEGAPGAGKSTLAWYICEQWGSGNLFGEFKLVVFIQLRSPAVQSATSVADLLPRMVSGQEREVLSHLETRCGRDVLLVLDGWDEYGGGLSQDSICGKLICSPGSLSMQKSTLLITSRPVASGELQQYCTTRIEIVGFAPNEVKEYFKDALKEAQQEVEQAEVLQECLKVRPVIQASCYLPLNAAIVAHLFIAEGNTLPTTLHGLFTSLVLNCIVRHLKKTRQEERKRLPKISSFITIPTDLQPHFNAICALAFHGIMTNKASFSEEELHAFGLSTDSSAPLLSLIQGWSTFKSSWEDLLYSFFHLSVQELLAAFHISKQPDEKQREDFKKLFGKPRFAAVLNFYAAFTKFCVQGIREFIKEVLQGLAAAGLEVHVHHQASRSEVQLPRKELCKTVLNCLFEAQDPELCQYIATVMEGKLTVDYTMSPFHCMVLGYFLHCLCLTPGGGEFHIDLANTDLDEYKCSYLINELKKCSHGQLSLSLFEGVQGGGVSVLIRMLEESCFHCISDLSLTLQINENTIKESLLTHNSRIPVVSLTITAPGSNFDSHPEHLLIQAPRSRVDARHMKPVPDFIVGSGRGTLKLLTLSGCVLCEGIAEVLVTCLTSRSVLDTLVVSDCTITPDGANILGNSLKLKASTAQVKTFYLSEGKPPDNAGTLSVESAHQNEIESRDALFETPHLRVLHLSRCTEVATVLGCFIAKNSNLEVIFSESMLPENKGLLAVALAVRSKLESWDLSGHIISSAGMKKLSKSAAKDPSLKVLNLSHCNIGLKATRVLVGSLGRNRSLKTLNLSHSTMPPEGATLLADLLARKSNLEALISGCKPPESAGILAVALAVRSPQESLDLSEHTVPPQSIKLLSHSLATNLSLKTLNLSCSSLPSEGIEMLADALADNQTLKTLNLSGCSIPLESALEVANGLARNSNLEVLISGCRPPESAALLAASLVVRSAEESWDLSGDAITPESMKFLANFLTGNRSLKTLNLSCSSMPPEGIKVLADSLANNQTLETLNLSQCSLSPHSVRVLAGSLSRNLHPVKVLNLPGSSITHESALTLVDCLNRNSKLKIFISGCGPPESAGVLAVVLAVRSTQESWDLSGHTIPTECINLLANSLAQNPSVKVLNLSRCSVPPQSLIMIAASVSRNPHLKTLNLSHCIVTPEDATVVAGIVAAHANLEVLISGCSPPESAGILSVALAVRLTQESWDLSGHTIPPEGVKMLVDSMADSPTLKTLNLSGCSITPKDTLTLACSLARHSKLEVLISGCSPPESAGILSVALAVRSTQESWDLSGHTIPPEGVKMLVDSMADSPTLKTLNLSGCSITPKDTLTLACSLARHSNLEVLISGCMPPESAGRLAVALAVRSTRESWDLSGHTIPLDGMKMLVDSLVNNPTLEALNLSDCSISPEGALTLVHSLPRNSNLEVLILKCRPPESAGLLAVALAVRSTQKTWDLSGHTIPLTGMKMLVDSLAYNPTLKALNLSGCCITPKGALALAHSLTRNSNLKVLTSGCTPLESAEILAVALVVRSLQESWDLSGHAIPPEGVEILATALIRNVSLKTLNLSCSSIPLEGINVLAEGLADNPTLETLNLSQCSLSPQSMKVLAGSLFRNPHLKVLNLPGCSITPKGALALVHCLDRNSKLKISISGCSPPESAGILAVVLAVRSAKETWDLSGLTLPPECMKLLADSLAHNPSVKVLNLSRCSVPPKSLIMIADSVSRNPQLKTLNLSHCIITPDEATVLAGIIAADSNLEVLISGCTPPESAGRLAVAIAVRSTQESWDLSGHRIPLEGVKMLVDSMADCPTLKTLNLSGCSIASEGAQALVHSLTRNSNLKVLIPGCRPPESAGVLAVFLAIRSAHKSLDLSGHTIPPEGMNMLADVLTDNSTLEAVNLSSCSISPKDTLTLARSLARNSNLEVLISGCRPPESAGLLAVALAVRSSQETWDLSGHTIPPEGMKMLAGSLAMDPIVKTLNLSRCIIPPEGVGALCDFLAEHTSLDTVLFSGCWPPVSRTAIDLALAVRSAGTNTCDLTGRSISDSQQTITALGYMLDSKLTIDTLNLSGCRISEREIELLAQTLLRNKHIKELNFSQCKLLDDRSYWYPFSYQRTAVDHLLASFTDPTHMSLKVLDLSWSGLGSQGLNALKRFLHFSRSLEVLILSNNDLSVGIDPYYDPHLSGYETSALGYKTHAHYLAQGLELNKTLRSLSITGCRLRYPLMEVILEALKRHSSLQELHFHGNRLTDSEFQALNRRLTTARLRKVIKSAGHQATALHRSN